MQAKYSHQSLKIIAINEDADREQATTFLEDYSVNFEVVCDDDGKLSESLKLKGMPTSYLFDRDGRLIMTHSGFRKSDKARLDAKLQDALESK